MKASVEQKFLVRVCQGTIGFGFSLAPDGVLCDNPLATMKTKADIVANWLPRYTGTPLKDFGKHILLVNFNNYVEMFAQWHKVPNPL